MFFPWAILCAISQATFTNPVISQPKFKFDWRITLISGVAAAGDGRGGLRERVPRAAGLQPLLVDRRRREGCERGHQDRVLVQLIRGTDTAKCVVELSDAREWPTLKESSPDFITDHYICLNNLNMGWELWAREDSNTLHYTLVRETATPKWMKRILRSALTQFPSSNPPAILSFAEVRDVEPLFRRHPHADQDGLQRRREPRQERAEGQRIRGRGRRRRRRREGAESQSGHVKHGADGAFKVSQNNITHFMY